MKKIVIDATNATLGRLSSYAAKQSLQGKEVVILNSEKAIITGKKRGIIEAYKEKRSRGGTALRGPNFPGTAERIVKRTIRGMLPNYRAGKGKEAFRRILCYKGIPEEYKNEKLIKAGKEKHTAYISVEEVSKKI
ncbi:50S ribosomal protein L13 [Candidatus Pacearchaeota archaeon RBG_13_36_9]|nr:MAG: 50S ribosomal protein L13 [Candidatus Pacearchaeota archaeon RBG_13_36_9]